MYINYGKKENAVALEGPKGDLPKVDVVGNGKRKRKFPLGVIVPLAILVPLLVLLVYEPGRFRVWADEMEAEWLRVPVSAVVGAAESVHNALGLPAYKESESDFLADAKNSPEVLSQDQQGTGSGDGSTQGDNSSSGSSDDGQTEGGAKYVEQPYTVLIVGDSLVLEGFGPILEEDLSSYTDIDVVRKGKYSTGLSRPDYFDWNDYIVELLDKYSPQVVIVMFGANDGQNFTVDGKPVTFDTEAWRAEYTKRADRFMSILDEYGVVTFWVGNPIAKSDYYTHKMEVINSCVEAAAVDHVNVHYISTWETLKNSSGEYSDYLPDESGKMKLARSSDGIHCTEFGGALLVKRVFEVMETYVEF